MNLRILFLQILCSLLIFSTSFTQCADSPQIVKPNPAFSDTLQAFKSKLSTALTRHLDQLLNNDNSVIAIKGKTGQGNEALAFYLVFEVTGEQKFRKAAISLADQVLKAMRATKFGVLPIKEKEKPDGKTITGGGPPAMGAYASSVAYILHREGGRNDDLKYIANVLDSYPWNEGGWWAADIDVATGESKEPMTKPSPVNKSAAIAMAAGIVSAYISNIDPEISARLKHKADKCIYAQIIPAQEKDGFCHYSLSGNDPKDKDVLGYFMLTTEELMKLQEFNPDYRDAKLNTAVKRAQLFALNCIAPMTEPNTNTACATHTTRNTPSHYSLKENSKRSFQLGRILIGGGYSDEGIKIMSAALEHFPIGNTGQDGALAAEPSALILSGY